MSRPRSKKPERQSTEATIMFGERLSDLVDAKKKSARMSQDQIADEIGISSASLSNYCSDFKTASIDSLWKIAQYFDVSADYLIGLSDDESRKPAAVDELGISRSAVSQLKRLHDCPPQMSEYAMREQGLKAFGEQALDFYSMFISSTHIFSILQECLPKLQKFYTLPEDVFRRAYAGMGQYHFASSSDTVIKFNQFLIEREIFGFIEYFCKRENDERLERARGEKDGESRK